MKSYGPQMALKLDDLIGKKKEAVQILDLSNSVVNSDEDFKKFMEKVPDFRIKAEKVKPEDIKIQDGEKKRRKKKKSKKDVKQYKFADPMPNEMRPIQLDDICSVNIQWNMLTDLRPKNKLDEEYFSRLVELGKLKLQTKEKESKIPDTDFLRKMKNKSGVEESRFISCAECGEEFCLKETCCLFQYENFKRESPMETLTKQENKEQGKVQTKRKKSKKPRGRPFRNRGSTRSRSKGKSNDDESGGSPKPKAKGKKKRKTVKGGKNIKKKPVKSKRRKNSKTNVSNKKV